MSPHLPPEIVDDIIDLLHDEPETLKRCCLVSKSWIFRTRKYLFNKITLTSHSQLKAWKKTFREDSPAFHTRSLVVVGCGEHVTAEDGEEGGWIRPFTNVVHLSVFNRHDRFKAGPNPSFVPFHILSTVKSLSVYFENHPPADVLNLVCSFPLLEDLAIGGRYHNSGDGPLFRPLHSSPLSGTLNLRDFQLYKILDMVLAMPPSRFGFRKIVLFAPVGGEVKRVSDLVEMCSGALECASMTLPYFNPDCEPVDLSKAEKLKEVELEFDGHALAVWTTRVLNTITPGHKFLERISICFSAGCFEPGASICEEWMDVDNILVQLCESRLCRVSVAYAIVEGMESACMYTVTESLLPKTTKKGLIDKVYSYQRRRRPVQKRGFPYGLDLVQLV